MHLFEDRICGGGLREGPAVGVAEELEVARDARLGNAGLGGHRAHAPMRRAVGWLGVQRGLDQVRHAFVVDRARRAETTRTLRSSASRLDWRPSTHLRALQIGADRQGARVDLLQLSDRAVKIEQADVTED